MVVVLACCLPRTPCPVVSRLRGNDGPVGLSCYHPLLPVSGTGTGFDPLPSRERGSVGCFVLLLPHVTRRPCGYCLEASMTSGFAKVSLDKREYGYGNSGPLLP